MRDYDFKCLDAAGQLVTHDTYACEHDVAAILAAVQSLQRCAAIEIWSGGALIKTVRPSQLN